MNSFTDDGTKGQRFDYMLANPPFGVEWKKVEDQIKTEAPDLKYGVAAIPAGPTGARGTYGVTDSIVLFENSKVKAEAWKFLDFIFTTEQRIKSAIENVRIQTDTLNIVKARFPDRATELELSQAQSTLAATEAARSRRG